MNVTQTHELEKNHLCQVFAISFLDMIVIYFLEINFNMQAERNTKLNEKVFKKNRQKD